ncbi:forkhead box protein E3 [Halyomorpha halys]|uniref:forkhead box protein E3 n=1 Tax=Halyomorpha halys TaxID=286706 RepID=UPI0006D50FD9|nr:forkhead box protein E3 [Halyomorpha halys]
MYPLTTVDQYRLQLYQYAVVAQRLYPGPYPSPYPPGRLPLGLRPEEPKPQHSYIGLIAMAILSSPEYKLVLSDIYQYILDHYPYFRTRGPGWRNSIRHNLSLNDCFVKAGRSANGKGHYWAIHPANVEDFKKGDFRRRKAQRKVRRHMGLAVDDDGADSPSPPPPPAPAPAAPSWPGPRKKRQFDVASLLAPDPEEESPWPCHTLNRHLMAKYYQQACPPESCLPRV